MKVFVCIPLFNYNVVEELRNAEENIALYILIYYLVFQLFVSKKSRKTTKIRSSRNDKSINLKNIS